MYKNQKQAVARHREALKQMRDDAVKLAGINALKELVEKQKNAGSLILEMNIRALNRWSL